MTVFRVRISFSFFFLCWASFWTTATKVFLQKLKKIAQLSKMFWRIFFHINFYLILIRNSECKQPRPWSIKIHLHSLEHTPSLKQFTIQRHPLINRQTHPKALEYSFDRLTSIVARRKRTSAFLSVEIFTKYFLMHFCHISLVSLAILVLIILPQKIFSDLQSNSSNFSEFNSTMSSDQAENLDKCFDVVSDIVQKAGDVN